VTLLTQIALDSRFHGDDILKHWRGRDTQQTKLQAITPYPGKENLHLIGNVFRLKAPRGSARPADQKDAGSPLDKINPATTITFHKVTSSVNTVSFVACFA
jgi:hypothetical protein